MRDLLSMRDLLWSWRQILRYPRVAVAAIGILALTCAAATALFSTLGPLWLSPFSFPDSERLVVLWEDLQGQTSLGRSSSLGFHASISSELAELAELAASRPILPVLWLDDRPAASLVGARVTTNFLKTLGIQPVVGRDFVAEDEQPESRLAILISHRVWRTHFGSDPDLGKLDARLDFGGGLVRAEVVGVLPDEQPIGKPLVWDRVEVLSVLPRAWTPERNDYAGRSFHLVGRLHRSEDLTRLQQQGQATASALGKKYPAIFTGWHFRTERATDLAIAPYRKALTTLIVLTLLVLLAACVNVAILLSARHHERAGELALRAAFGATPWAINRLLLVEGLLLAGLACLPGLAGAHFLLEQLRSLSQERRLQEVHVQADGILFAIGLCVLMALLFSFIPRLGAPLRAYAIGTGIRSPQRRNLWHRRLLCLEVTAGVLILTTAITVTLGFLRLVSIDPGFSADRVWVATLRQSVALGGHRDPSLYEHAVRALESLPQIEKAGIIRFPPMSGSVLTIEARTEDDIGILVGLDGVGPRTFESLGIPMIRGRGVLPEDLTRSADESTQPIWISRSLADRLQLGHDLNTTLELSFLNAPFRVAGVVGDIRRLSLSEAPQPAVYVAYTQLPRLHAYLLAQSENPKLEGDRAAIHQTLADLDPRLVVEDLHPLQEWVDRTTEKERILTFLSLALTILGLALITSGLWAVANYRVQQRFREMGIRAAIGAPPKSLWRETLRPILVDTTLGIGVGALAGFLSADAAATLLFENAEPPHLGSLVAAAIWLMLLATGAVFLATRRLRSLNPMDILRED